MESLPDMTVEKVGLRLRLLEIQIQNIGEETGSTKRRHS